MLYLLAKLFWMLCFLLPFAFVLWLWSSILSHHLVAGGGAEGVQHNKNDLIPHPPNFLPPAGLSSIINIETIVYEVLSH